MSSFVFVALLVVVAFAAAEFHTLLDDGAGPGEDLEGVGELDDGSSPGLVDGSDGSTPELVDGAVVADSELDKSKTGQGAKLKRKPKKDYLLWLVDEIRADVNREN
ncbi:hypothetical protein JCM1840_000458 [Sporobolomyces johnsonii]